MSDEKPQVGALTSEAVFRINSTAWKINEAFNAARREASDEALWLSHQCRELLADNDRLRVENEKLQAKLKKMEHSANDAT